MDFKFQNFLIQKTKKMESELLTETQLTEPQLFDSEQGLLFSTSEEETEMKIEAREPSFSSGAVSSSFLEEEFSSQKFSQTFKSQQDQELDDIFGEDSDDESPKVPQSQLSAVSPLKEEDDEDLIALDEMDEEPEENAAENDNDDTSMDDNGDEKDEKEPNDEKKVTDKDKESDEDDDEEQEEKEQEEEKEKEKNLVVQSEIEAIKRIEQGPSEAELRRRKLIEMWVHYPYTKSYHTSLTPLICFNSDEDELEEKIEQLNKRGLEIITKSTGLSKEQRKQRLIECRTFLARIWKSEKDEDVDHAEFIEINIEKQYNRLFPVSDDVPFDALEYLERDSYSSDDKSDDDNDDDKEEEEKKEEMICLSDSSDDEDSDREEGGAGSGNTTDQSISPLRPLPPPTTTRPALPSNDPRRRFRQLLLQQHQQQRLMNKNSKTALLFSLRQKIHETAMENYCHQKKIAKEDLQLRLEIAERCR